MGMRKEEDAAPDTAVDRRDPELLRLLANALESAEAAVVIVDRDRKIVWANPALERLSGWAPEEVIGNSTPKYWSSSHPASFYDQIWETLLSGQKWHGELIGQRKDGSHFDEERIITPIRNAQGQVTHFIGIRLDITERKRAENLASHLLQVAAKTPNLVGMADREGKFFYVNRTLQQAVGYTEQELIGQHFSILLAGGDSPKFRKELGARMFEPSGWTGEAQVLRKDGSDLSVFLILQPLTDKQGQVIGAFGIARDVTAQKQAEASLQQSREMFEALFESSPEAMLAVDEQGHIVRVNFQVERLFGYDRSELLGAPISSLIPEHSRLPHLDRQLDHHPRLMSDEVELHGRRRDGTEFPVEMEMSLLQTHAGSLVLTVVRDVTRRKQAENALKEAHERLNIALRNAERQSREAARLGELVDILQSCQTLREAYEVTASSLKEILPCKAGAVCITNPSHSVVEVMAAWGDSQATEKIFRPEECWALRRSKVHQVKDATSPLKCAHVHGGPEGSYFCVPLSAQGETFGVLYLEWPPEAMLSPAPRERRSDHVDVEIRQATALGERLSLAFGNLRLREALRTQSIRDPLTNLYNRRYMEESLEREISRSARSGQPVALLLMDIDHFKLFNDTFGHQGGDTLLRTLGDFLSQRTRGQDVACRYGGEEFAVILSGANRDSAIQRAQILRDDLKSMIVEHAGQIVSKITISIGVAVAPDNGTTAGDLLRAADASLYRAKAEGRDRIVIA